MKSTDLRTRLENVTNLPSPPAVAANVINLAQQVDINLSQVAEAITCDPSLTAKILRVANSCMYAQRRKSENLRQALVVLGINATVTLALGFSLLPMMRRSESQNQQFAHSWRRSVMSAVAARILASRMRGVDAEKAFLAALLQDIGIMAIDRLEPNFYAGADLDHTDHEALSKHETQVYGSDHAAVGAWLLEQWGIPGYLPMAVAASHTQSAKPTADTTENLHRCVALSGQIADLWLLMADQDSSVSAVANRVSASLGIGRDKFAGIMTEIGASIPDIAAMFETDLLNEEEAQLIVERANEALTMRNLHSIQEAAELGRKTKELKDLAIDLQEETQRDALTRVASRGYLEELLGKGFDHARRFGWPFSIAFIDLDHFKSVNDTYGHQVGDDVLRQMALMLTNQVRCSDTVGRYGGEEFLLLLPGTDDKGARVVAERVLKAARDLHHAVGDGQTIVVTASIGCASLSTNTQFASPAEFVRAADQALYAAKHGGRDRCIQHGESPPQAAIGVAHSA